MESFYKKKFLFQKYFCWLLAAATLVLYAVLAVDCFKKSEFGGRFWGMTICLVFLLVIVVLASPKDYMHNINEYCEKYGCSISQLEAEFDRAEKLTSRLICSEHYIYFFNMVGHPDIVDMRKVDRMECEVESSGRVSHTYAHIYYADGTDKEVPCSRKNYKRLEEMVKEHWKADNPK